LPRKCDPFALMTDLLGPLLVQAQFIYLDLGSHNSQAKQFSLLSNLVAKQVGHAINCQTCSRDDYKELMVCCVATYNVAVCFRARYYKFYVQSAAQASFL
jgi:hypothetical protein